MLLCVQEVVTHRIWFKTTKLLLLDSLLQENVSSGDGIVYTLYTEIYNETFVQVRGKGWELEYNDICRICHLVSYCIRWVTTS